MFQASETHGDESHRNLLVPLSLGIGCLLLLAGMVAYLATRNNRQADEKAIYAIAYQRLSVMAARSEPLVISGQLPVADSGLEAFIASSFGAWERKYGRAALTEVYEDFQKHRDRRVDFAGVGLPIAGAAAPNRAELSTIGMNAEGEIAVVFFRLADGRENGLILRKGWNGWGAPELKTTAAMR